MLIAIISDSHDHLTRLEWAVSRAVAEGAEGLIHPGDIIAPFAANVLVEGWKGPRVTVYGNNDGERKGLAAVLPEITEGPILVEWGGRRISLDHYPPTDQRPAVAGCDVTLFGHTHEPMIAQRPEGLWLNPGETCGWVNGKPTFALLDTESLKVDLVPIEG